MEAFSLFLLWLLFGRCSGSGGGTGLLPALPGGEPGWPGSPISYTPPWPQAAPTGLPPFPGAGWEFDEPPPPAVQQRARQLVDALWAQGSGAFRIEQTAGRWIAYQAQVVASGKRGVVAYRQKRAQLPAGSAATALRAKPPQRAPAPRSSIPSSPAASSSSQPPSPPAAAKPSSYNVQVGPAQVRTSPVSPVTLPTLVRGAGIPPKQPSPNVRVLQQRLGIAPVDGQFGGQTEAAVMAFQRQHGLEVDGIVGDKTWAALFAAGSARA